MNNKTLRTVTVLWAVVVLSFILGCGEKKTPDRQEADIYEECEIWCKTHKVPMGGDSVKKRVSFIIVEPIEEGKPVPFEIEQGGKKLQLPGQGTTLNASMQALAKFASSIKEETETSKIGNATAFTAKASLSIGELSMQSTQTVKDAENDEQISKSILLKRNNTILLEYTCVCVPDRMILQRTGVIKTYHDFDIFLRENGIKMDILFAAFNNKEAAFVFVFDLYEQKRD